MLNNTPHHYSGMEQTIKHWDEMTEIEKAIVSLTNRGFYLFETKSYLYVHKTRKVSKFGASISDIENMEKLGKIIGINFKSGSIDIAKHEAEYILK